MVKNKTKNIDFSFVLFLSLFVICDISRFFLWDYWSAEAYPIVIIQLLSIYILWEVFTNSQKINFYKIDFCIILFLFFELINSYVCSSSVFPPSDRIYNLTTLIFGYIAFKLFWSKESHLSKFIIILIVLILSESFLGLFQYFTHTNFRFESYKIIGTFKNPNIYASFVALGLPISLYIFLFKFNTPKLKFLIVLLLGVLSIICLFLSSSRTTLIAVIIVSFFLISHKILQENLILSKYKRLFYSSAFIIFLLFVYFLWLQDTHSVSGRFLIWKISFFDIFLKHPINGIGYGNLYIQYGNYQSDYFLSGRGTTKEMLLAGMTNYPFNEFLKILVENGIIGIVLFALIVIMFIKSSLFITKESILYSSIIGIILLISLFSYPLEDLEISLIVFGCIIGVSVNQKSLFSINTNRSSVKIAFLLCCSILTIFYISKLNAINQWRLANENITINEAKSYKLYHNISSRFSENGIFLFDYGMQLFYVRDYENCTKYLNRATHYVNSVELYSYLADSYFALNNNKLAEQNYIKASYMVPKTFTPFYNLFCFYRDTNQNEKARKVAERIINMPVKIESDRVRQVKSEVLFYVNRHK